jgi:hypothetical protein
VAEDRTRRPGCAEGEVEERCLTQARLYLLISAHGSVWAYVAAAGTGIEPAGGLLGS